MKYFYLSMIVLMFFSYPTHAQETAIDVKDFCKSLKVRSSPSNEVIKPIEKEFFENCNSWFLYYGLEDNIDDRKIKKCALVQKDYDVLMMLYANGRGVKKNLNMALYYACKSYETEFEVDKHIDKLLQMKDRKVQDEVFDICKNVSTDFMMSRCLFKDQKLERKRQKKELDFLKLNWSSRDIVLFEKVLNTGHDYFKTRARSETDSGGTLGPIVVMSQEMSLEKRMMKDIHMVTQCNPPQYTLNNFREFDKKLNFIYRKFFNEYNTEDPFYNPQEVRKTQRAWIKYRDAWLVFGKSRCPKIIAESWMTLITKERILDLEDMEKMVNF